MLPQMDAVDSQDEQGTPRVGLVPRRGYLLALAVLLGTLAVVLAAWQNARERELRSAQAEFSTRADEIAERFQRRMIYYELVARGGTSLFASVARPTPRQWGDYVEGMNIRERFPGMLGLGFAGYVSGSRLDDLQIEWRDAGYGQLDVWPHGIRRYYGPILYLEPRTQENVAAIGFDMYSEPTRHAAMQAALETGAARLSGPVRLIQTPSSTGLLLYLPVYRGGDRPQTAAARAESMQGWVYVPFQMDRFVAAALGNDDTGARFRIYDVTEKGEVLLFASRVAEDGQAPAFRHSTTMENYGRKWRIDFDSPPLAMAAPRLAGLQNMLALGLFAALLMYGIAWMLARTEDRAHAIALRLTEDYRRSEQRFRSSMQYSAIGKALLDSEGRIVEANPALGRIVGRGPASLVGLRFDSLFEDDESTLQPGNDGRTEANGVHRTTRRLHREGQMPRQAQLTYAPVPGNVGQDISGLVQAEDITERVRAEARVHALNRTLEARVALRTRELSQVNQELEAFAYSVSHDLRAPLRAIDGFSRILGERYAPHLDEAGRDYLIRVRRAAARMGELIDAMLKISRLGRAELRREPVDLTRMAVEVLDELRAGGSRRDVEIRIAPGLQVIGDAVLLRNLLGNLLGNAWKFTSERDQAVIEFGAVMHSNGETEYYVRDNGAGFAQEYGDKLFRPFQRLHSQDEFAGHGIGLASVKRIIERHGGTIRAEGSEGEGAVFYFTIPDVNQEPETGNAG
ncbi:MAG TPA: CHASE domain-containing protein [Lysobacter sp.]